jgi:hypothetical protein
VRILFLALAASVGCAADPTQLLVVVDTDLEAGVEYDAILVSAGADVGSDERRFEAGEVELPFSIGIAAGDAKDGAVRVTVSLWTREGEHTYAVVTRQAYTHFLPEQTRRLDVVLSRNCLRASEECLDEQTCVDGACVSALVDPNTLPHGDPGAPLMSLVDGPRVAPDAGDDAGVSIDADVCEEGAACSPAACRTGVCTSGECVENGFEPRGTECGAGAGRTCTANGMCGDTP